jgi:cytochrome c556
VRRFATIGTVLAVVLAVAEEVRFQGQELCLSQALASFAGAFSVLSKIVPGALPPDPGKLRAEVEAWLKTMSDAVQNCGLPAPETGMPALPDPA